MSHIANIEEIKEEIGHIKGFLKENGWSSLKDVIRAMKPFGIDRSDCYTILQHLEYEGITKSKIVGRRAGDNDEIWIGKRHWKLV